MYSFFSEVFLGSIFDPFNPVMVSANVVESLFASVTDDLSPTFSSLILRKKWDGSAAEFEFAFVCAFELAGGSSAGVSLGVGFFFEHPNAIVMRAQKIKHFLNMDESPE
jgi:hypothetical protein